MLIKYGYGMLFDGDVMLRESVLKCSEVAWHLMLLADYWLREVPTFFGVMSLDIMQAFSVMCTAIQQAKEENARHVYMMHHNKHVG
jgi:hypothetical protein